jgi:hypothetical protein
MALAESLACNQFRSAGRKEEAEIKDTGEFPTYM